MAAVVDETLGQLVLGPEDAAAAALARRYAVTIDEARELAEAAARVPYDPDTAAQVARLRERVQAHVVMVELGPKLLAALDALHATPAARAKVAKPKTGATAGSKLAQLRAG
jgi:hypothetical protein